MVQFTMPPIKATQSQAPPQKSTFIKPRKHHVASNDKATIVHHLLKQSQPTKKKHKHEHFSTPKTHCIHLWSLGSGQSLPLASQGRDRHESRKILGFCKNCQEILVRMGALPPTPPETIGESSVHARETL